LSDEEDDAEDFLEHHNNADRNVREHHPEEEEEEEEDDDDDENAESDSNKDSVSGGKATADTERRRKSRRLLYRKTNRYFTFNHFFTDQHLAYYREKFKNGADAAFFSALGSDENETTAKKAHISEKQKGQMRLQGVFDLMRSEYYRMVDTDRTISKTKTSITLDYLERALEDMTLSMVRGLDPREYRAELVSKLTKSLLPEVICCPHSFVLTIHPLIQLVIGNTCISTQKHQLYRLG